MVIGLFVLWELDELQVKCVSVFRDNMQQAEGKKVSWHRLIHIENPYIQPFVRSTHNHGDKNAMGGCR